MSNSLNDRRESTKSHRSSSHRILNCHTRSARGSFIFCNDFHNFKSSSNQNTYKTLNYTTIYLTIVLVFKQTILLLFFCLFKMN